MRLLGYILVAILSALYTSAWWARFVFDLVLSVFLSYLLSIFIVGGIVVFIVFVMIYLIDNWEKIWG